MRPEKRWNILAMTLGVMGTPNFITLMATVIGPNKTVANQRRTKINFFLEGDITKSIAKKVIRGALDNWLVVFVRPGHHGKIAD